ncbi:hypothetical protein OXX59_002395 [Metschnikowia pulcherrima]
MSSIPVFAWTASANNASLAAALCNFAAATITKAPLADALNCTIPSAETTGTILRHAQDLQSFLAKRDRDILYKYELNRPGNIIFLVIFTLIASFNFFMAFRSKQKWYNICFITGFVLEQVGFIGRVLGFMDNQKTMYYAMQSLCLTVAPAFIMAGIYFLFAQSVAVHGRQYSLLKPMWYSYFFISADILSILIQATGGALLSDGGKSQEKWGDIIMFVGILIQIVAITIFLFFWFIFLGRTFFHDRDSIPAHCSYRKKSALNYIKLLLNVPSAREYKLGHLDAFYNPKYQSIRFRTLYSYYPLALSVAVILVYIRCLYRVVELKMGFDGYLMSHEVYLFVLDSVFIALTGFVFIPFHPMFVFGRDNVLTKKDIQESDNSIPQQFVFHEGNVDREKDFAFAAERREEVSLRTSL